MTLTAGTTAVVITRPVGGDRLINTDTSQERPLPGSAVSWFPDGRDLAHFDADIPNFPPHANALQVWDSASGHTRSIESSGGSPTSPFSPKATRPPGGPAGK